MAIFQTKRMSAENGDKTLFLKFLVSTVGVIASFSRRQGFTQTPAAAVRTGAGAYTLNLDQRWQDLLAAGEKIIGAVTNTSGFEMEVTAVNLNVAQPNVTVQFRRNSDFAAADVPDASSVTIWLVLKDSTV